MLSSRHRNIQDKTNRLSTALASQLRMNIQVKKTKIMKINTNNSEPVIINHEQIEEVRVEDMTASTRAKCVIAFEY